MCLYNSNFNRGGDEKILEPINYTLQKEKFHDLEILEMGWFNLLYRQIEQMGPQSCRNFYFGVEGYLSCFWSKVVINQNLMDERLQPLYLYTEGCKFFKDKIFSE